MGRVDDSQSGTRKRQPLWSDGSAPSPSRGPPNPGTGQWPYLMYGAHRTRRLYEKVDGHGHGSDACIFLDRQDINVGRRSLLYELRTVSAALRASTTQRRILILARSRPAARPQISRLYGGSSRGARSLQRSMPPSALNAAGTDLELIERIQGGDDRALGELYDRHGPVMYSLARSIVSEPADAEEVVADAFLQIWRGATQYDRGRASVGAFLAVVTSQTRRSRWPSPSTACGGGPMASRPCWESPC